MVVLQSMTSKTQKKKLKTLTEEAIETIRSVEHRSITREWLERQLQIDSPMASRVVSALQKVGILGRPQVPFDLLDPVGRATVFSVKREKIK